MIFSNHPERLADSSLRQQAPETRRSKTARARLRKFRRLAIEALEEKRMLTTLMVTSLSDAPIEDLAGDDELSLREAIEAANTDTSVDGSPAGNGADTIHFAPNLSGGTIALAGMSLWIADDLSIHGLGEGALTISGDNTTGIYEVDFDVSLEITDQTIRDGHADGFSVGAAVYNAGVVTLNRVTMANNHSEGNGGALFNEDGASAIIAKSTFSLNTAGASGGAISNYAGSNGRYGSLTITDTVFSENSAGAGGAIWNDGPATISDSRFVDNTARAWGGGIAHARNDLAISNSTFANNSSGSFGGGLDNSSRGVVTITNSTLTGNSTGSEGGAIENFGGDVRIANSTISGNSSNGQGGGIFSLGGLQISNSTIVQNHADADGNGSGSGGGIYVFNTSSRPNPILDNSIVAGNMHGANDNSTNDDVAGSLDPTSRHNLIGDAATTGGLLDGVNGNLVGSGGVGVIDITLVLDPNLADNGVPTWTHALVDDSPAIDSGDNAKATDAEGNPLNFDQRGGSFARIAGEVVDLGAFEVQPPQEIKLDVKPGSAQDPINLASQGMATVAILTTDEFDAARVDVSTVIWAGANVARKNDDSFFASLEDTDGDGDLDLVLHFQLVETDLFDAYEDLLRGDLEDGKLDARVQSVDVAIVGLTKDGAAFRGFDSIDLFLAGKHLNDRFPNAKWTRRR